MSLFVVDREEVRKLAGLVVDWMKFLIEKQYELAMSFHMDRIVKGWDAGLTLSAEMHPL